MQLDSLYQEIILDHYRSPHHAGLAEPYDVEVHHVNPSCGDEVTLRVELDGDTVTGVTHESLGCSISQAATSVMSDLVIGKPVAEGMATYEKFLELMQGRGQVQPDEEVLEDGVAFAGVAQFPARVKCALLGWSAWRDATAQALALDEIKRADDNSGVSNA
jgi:nitrogen fixation NifU-like protein